MKAGDKVVRKRTGPWSLTFTSKPDFFRDTGVIQKIGPAGSLFIIWTKYNISGDWYKKDDIAQVIEPNDLLKTLVG